MTCSLNEENASNNAEHLDEQAELDEVAYLIRESDGFGMEITIHSIDNPPAHMHIDDPSTHETFARVFIPSTEPKSIDDIRTLEEDSLTSKQKEVILEILKSDDAELVFPMWKLAKWLWSHRK